MHDKRIFTHYFFDTALISYTPVSNAITSLKMKGIRSSRVGRTVVFFCDRILLARRLGFICKRGEQVRELYKYTLNRLVSQSGTRCSISHCHNRQVWTKVHKTQISIHFSLYISLCGLSYIYAHFQTACYTCRSNPPKSIWLYSMSRLEQQVA